MSRPLSRLLAAIVPASLIVGCGTGSSPSKMAVAPPHGGHLFAFPENRGFVEIKTDRAAPSRGGRAPAARARIQAYFYRPDGTTAMSPAPTDVKVQIGTDARSTLVALDPEPKEAGLFASEPGMYPEGFRGQLEATINGEPVKVPFLFR